MGFCGTYWGIWLLLGCIFFFFLIHDNVIWQNILQKNDYFFCLLFSDCCHKLTLFFSLVCLIEHRSPSRIDFYADCNSPFLLCYCMFSLRRQKRICLQHLCSYKRSNRSISTEIWHSLSCFQCSEWSDNHHCAKMSL